MSLPCLYTAVSGWCRFAAGYGMLFVPSSPGSYDLDCVTWRPQGSLTDRFSGETTTLSFPSYIPKTRKKKLHFALLRKDELFREYIGVELQ